jgi:hypothetical protein
MMRLVSWSLACALAVCSGAACAADAPKAPVPDAPVKAGKGDIAEAERNRTKPLQRCDQLSDKAQLECLEKARERIVEARAKRDASGKDAAPR